MIRPERWQEILYFYQHPEEHEDSDYICDDGEEGEIVLWAESLRQQNEKLVAALNRCLHMDEGCGGNLTPEEIFLSVQDVARSALREIGE